MYKDYTQIEDMKVMGALNLYRLTKSPKRGALCAINLIKENMLEIKGKKMCILKATKMLHIKGGCIITNYMFGFPIPNYHN